MSTIFGLRLSRPFQSVAEHLSSMGNLSSVYEKVKPSLWHDRLAGVGIKLEHTVPEDRFDRQPLQTQDGSVLVSDIRLDNRDELFTLLALPYPVAHSMAYSDILLAAWERWGEDCVDALI